MADYDMFAFTVPQMFMNPIHLKTGLMWMADRCIVRRDEDGEIGEDRSGLKPELIGRLHTQWPHTIPIHRGERGSQRAKHSFFFPLIIVFTCQGGIKT